MIACNAQFFGHQTLLSLFLSLSHTHTFLKQTNKSSSISNKIISPFSIMELLCAYRNRQCQVKVFWMPFFSSSFFNFLFASWSSFLSITHKFRSTFPNGNWIIHLQILFSSLSHSDFIYLSFLISFCLSSSTCVCFHFQNRKKCKSPYLFSLTKI